MCIYGFIDEKCWFYQDVFDGDNTTLSGDFIITLYDVNSTRRNVTQAETSIVTEEKDYVEDNMLIDKWQGYPGHTWVEVADSPD